MAGCCVRYDEILDWQSCDRQGSGKTRSSDNGMTKPPRGKGFPKVLHMWRWGSHSARCYAQYSNRSRAFDSTYLLCFHCQEILCKTAAGAEDQYFTIFLLSSSFSELPKGLIVSRLYSPSILPRSRLPITRVSGFSRSITSEETGVRGPDVAWPPRRPYTSSTYLTSRSVCRWPCHSCQRPRRLGPFRTHPPISIQFPRPYRRSKL